MKLTDIFIQRPVLAMVISLLIFILGLRAIQSLQLREYPEMQNTVISINTAYPGASAELIQSFVTAPLQKSIASADGIDYLVSNSSFSGSSIQAFIKLNYDPEKAFTNIMSKVAQTRGELPKESQDPIITKDTGSSLALMYISFSSKTMNPQQITDYVARVVQPKIETVTGVAGAEVLGKNNFAMRVWLNPEKMAALKLTTEDISNALHQKNFQSSAGKTKGDFITVNINASTDLHTVDEFKNIVIKNEKEEGIIHLRDIAKIELGSQNYDSFVTFNGQQAVFIGVTATPSANPLSVIKEVKKILPQLEKNYPSALQSKVVYDATKYIRDSIHEVIKTLTEATIIVMLVIFAFLGSFRSVLIPIITIPLSLVGVCFFMLALGYSLNLLTLLAMVLAIGLVVDDAIVVVENIHRHIEEGKTPLESALMGAREIAIPIITMTLTLAAVYAPIGFMGGLTGSLFKEFAFTLASAVIISGIVALTLSPMMCSKLLLPEHINGRIAQKIDHFFGYLKNKYENLLAGVLNYVPVTLLFALTVLVSCFFLYQSAQKELAPTEDQSFLFVFGQAPQTTDLGYLETFSNEFNNIFKTLPGVQDYFAIAQTENTVFSGTILKPWNERKESQADIQNILNEKVRHVAGLKVFVSALPPLPVGGNMLPIQFVLTTTGSYELLYENSQKLLQAAQKSGLFMFIQSDLEFTKPEIEVIIDRDKAAAIGVEVSAIGQTLSTAFAGYRINQFSMAGRSYEVIPQLANRFRLNPNQIAKLYVRAKTNELVPLSTVVSFKEKVLPNTLSQFQQLNAATMQGIMMPGISEGQALDFLKQQAEKILPKGISYDFGGQSRRYIQEGNALLYTFFFAFIVIFLVLSAQFESFRDPWIILISVPMSICGALIPLNIGHFMNGLASINIYTQIGLITLIGLISKHGILMVDFANHLQKEEKLPVREAIEKAASIRLRPILMTTAAMILGVVPLLISTGPGAVSRSGIGIVISSGMAIGTLFTLFVLPTMYIVLNKISILRIFTGVIAVAVLIIGAGFFYLSNSMILLLYALGVGLILYKNLFQQRAIP
ncbi:MAG: efflux RND transporter permease subunit [Proteobacteria bacterium]|nr:efflux RND transporter permease subunit [Pseudomonadota bacterium]